MSHYRLTISTFLLVELKLVDYTVSFLFDKRNRTFWKKKKNILSWCTKQNICIHDTYILEQL